VLQGVPFRFDDTLRMTYEGNLFGLFNPFALLCGLVSLTMLTMHGATWLAVKTEGEVRERAQRYGLIAALAMALLFAAGGLWAAGLDGYVLQSFAGPDAPSNPLRKEVTRQAGALMANYGIAPVAMLAPIVAIACALLTALLLATRRARVVSFLAGAVAIAAVIATAGISLYPFMLPSSIDPNSSLMVWDASSSLMTLVIMTGATAIFLPIVLAYTAWVYRVLRGPVTPAQIESEPHISY
jgi:cytochrome d ubiquinol oxidase subunit II